MPWTCIVDRVAPDRSERSAIAALVDGILSEHHQHLDLPAALGSIAIAAHELPTRIRKALYNFKTEQRAHALCLSMGPLNDNSLGPTPTSYRPTGAPEPADQHVVLQLLFASLLGEAFGWSTIQDGNLVNDVMPIAQNADLIASSGYAVNFELHTEDAFHPWAGDYLGLLCLRNPDSVPTRLSGVVPEDLPSDCLSVLFEPRFVVGANVAQRVAEIEVTSPILFGHPTRPYLRVNLNNTHARPGDDAATEALGALTKALQANVSAVVFRSGDYWFLDNLRVAHGRDRFQPRHDGGDRWLRRLYISSAFRYTAGFRATPESRTLIPNTDNRKGDNDRA